MTHKFLNVLVGLVALFTVLHGSAQAKDDAPACGIEYEVIYKLRDPQIGTYSVWSTVWGDQELQESFSRIVPLANGEVFAVGYRDAEDAVPKQLIFAQIRKNGRLRWNKTYALAGVQSIVKIMPQGAGYLVVVNVTDGGRDYVWFGHVDADGAVVSSSKLEQRGHNITAQDIIVTPSDITATKPVARSGYVLAASVVARSEGAKSSAVFYALDDKMRARSKRSVIMGLENRILGLRGLDDGGYFGAGYSVGTDGRKDGWIVRMNADGVIQWQRQYPRGAGAQFVVGDTLLADAFVAVGTAAPLVPGGARSGWAMAVSRDDGSILWQRYFSGSLEMFGRDMLVSDGGVISVLLDAEMLEVEGEEEEEEETDYEEYVVETDYGIISDDALITDHVRIIQLNPRGDLLKGEEYFNGEGTDAHSLVHGLNGERIIVGSTDMVYTLNDPVKNAVQGAESGVEEASVLRRGRDAWLSAAVPVDAYKDPCKPKPYRRP